LIGTRHEVQRDQQYEGTTHWKGERAEFNGVLRELPPEHPDWSWPLDWPGLEHPWLGAGAPSLIFVGSVSDLFVTGRPQRVIDQVIGTLIYSEHIGLVLSKYTKAMAAYFEVPQHEKLRQREQQRLWLGFSAEDQYWFDKRWEHMRPLAASGFVVFVSVAPMIGPVRLPSDFLDYGERVWVICSGEQLGERPMDPQWARSLLAQCRQAGVPFFMLQMGGRKEIPLDLSVWEFPRGPR
jgi:protein gp37